MDSIFRTTGQVSASDDADAALSTLLTGAVETARSAVADHSGAETVGDYLGVAVEDAVSATHRFVAQLPGYRGWQWAVVVAGYPGAEHVTVSEVVLVPGPTALLAPGWVPWEQRVRPGDLGPGDLLAAPSDDPRLVPGYCASGDPDLDEVAGEIGLGRRQVLSRWGRAMAAERWHEGDFGPDSTMARSTKRLCRTCGFFVPLAGSLGRMFGVCANEMSADGRVVDFRYGCGAHSDTPAPAGTGSPRYEPYDDGVLDVADNPVPEAELASEAEPAADAEPVITEPPEAEPVPEAEPPVAGTDDPEPPSAD
ncbi:hypothetical protein BHQ15_04220 [Mycolicibacillus koreensis]|nr:hypothetical protein BHQ15_04220 [Mycolicibacillus koreensis]